jgi:hypothetical protein
MFEIIQKVSSSSFLLLSLFFDPEEGGDELL